MGAVYCGYFWYFQSKGGTGIFSVAGSMLLCIVMSLGGVVIILRYLKINYLMAKRMVCNQWFACFDDRNCEFAMHRSLRSSVIGRKNYYGSGALWSAELTAALFTIFKTIKLAGLNPHTWLIAYLQECVMHGGKPPDDVEKFLPWNMTEPLKALFAQPPQFENPVGTLNSS